MEKEFSIVDYSPKQSVLVCSQSWEKHNKKFIDEIKHKFKTDLDVNKVPSGKGYVFWKYCCEDGNDLEYARILNDYYENYNYHTQFFYSN